MPNAPRRMLTRAGAVVLLIAASLSLGVPANAARAESGPVASPVTPIDGATVAAGQVVLTWTSSSPAASYDVRWGTVEEPGPDGLLVADGSVSGLTEPSYELADLADLSYHWQVRAVDAGGATGPWSEPSSFTVLAGSGDGEQLDTLAPDGAGAPERAPGGWADVDGILYLVVAAAFAVLLLTVVARAAVRVRA